MARKRRSKGIPGLSFSWKRAAGLSSAKARASRKLGFSVSKLEKALKPKRGSGCCIPALLMLGSTVAGGATAIHVTLQLIA